MVDSVQVLTIVIILITRVTRCSTQLCGIGCTDCTENNNCIQCRNGYFLSLKDQHYRCSHCPDNCATCNSLMGHAIRNVNCYSCKNGYYLHIQENKYRCSKCPANCKTCKSLTYKHEHVQCETCLDGFYLYSQNNTDRCTCNDGYYLSDNKCKECPSGRWGQECKLSCIPCSECVSDACTRECLTKSGTVYCQHQHSTCHNECSKGFTGQQRSDVSTTITVPTTIGQRTERIITQLTTTQRQQKTTRTTIIITEPPQTPTSYITPSITEYATTVKAEAQTNGSGSPVLYIVIAVLAGLVLTGVIVVVVVCVKWRKQTRCRDQEVSPHNSNNEESLKLTDNARGNINISNHENAINVAESDTGYVDMNTIDNVGTVNIAESDTGLVDMNTIATIASINVVASNTGVVNMNASAYMNIGNKTAINATDNSNAYEALSQYTNVRDAENEYTAISGNESVYYSVPN